MTPDQVSLVELSFVKVKLISEQASALFYGRLFEKKPELRPLFKGDMKEQGRLLMATLATAVALLKRPVQLQQAVEDLGVRHAKYNVQTEHFEPVGEALIWTLEKGLGPDFTPEVKAAWIAMYQIVSMTMIRGLRRGQSDSIDSTTRPAENKLHARSSETWLERLWRSMRLMGRAR
jgi:nitric oxide dioxygenase